HSRITCTQSIQGPVPHSNNFTDALCQNRNRYFSSFKQTLHNHDTIFLLFDTISAPVEIRGPIRPSVHWTIERAVAVSMLPMYPMAFILDNPIMNFVTVTAVSLHAYWGFYEVIRDYAFERRYGPLLMPILHTIWRIVCIIGYSGFLYFNFNDIGAIGAIKKLWSV
ncbi:unnamed protein product, partial [Protopolystoma xenopodis]